MKIASALCVLALAGSAFATITPVAPFTGSASENFTNITPPFQFQAQYTGLFGGAAVLNAFPAGATAMHLTSGWGFFVTVFARSAPLMAAGAGCNAEYVFDAPVTKFGGYFTTNADSGGATAVFLDDTGAIIGEQPVQAPQGTWAWDGWESTTPIKSVRILASNQFGGFIQMDDLEIQAGGGCDADYNGNGSVDFFDYLDFVQDFANLDPRSDWDGNGSVDFFDYLDFAQDFADCQ
jgi:hypothetical protein